MHEKPVFLTPEGRAKLVAELKHLKVERRPEVAERIKASKEFSDTTDNSEYDESKNEQAFVEGRILTIERLLANAVLIEGSSDPTHETVGIGSKVTLVNDDGETETYTIVGSAEASPRLGRISNESPVGRAVLGKRLGESVEVAVPAGIFHYKISSIE